MSDLQEELSWIKYDWFTEDNWWEQVDRIRDVLDNYNIPYNCKTPWDYWELLNKLVIN